MEQNRNCVAQSVERTFLTFLGFREPRRPYTPYMGVSVS